MSTHHVRRLYPRLRARHRRSPLLGARRCAFHALPEDRLGAFVRNVDSAKHSEQFRRLGPLAVARSPENSGGSLDGQKLICENDWPETQNGQPATASRSETPSWGPRTGNSGTWPNPLMYRCKDSTP
jgi:hypothetical protein